jgi:endonuclease/exonuclease/phosphatase family metal-dependent hydrolase
VTTEDDLRKSVRVGTFNLLHGLDVRTRQVDLAAAAAAIAALDLDVVALQEVDRALTRSGGVDQVTALAERLGYQGAFAPALLGDPGTRWRTVGARDPGGPAYGVGLLSRWPLLRTTRSTLPGGGAGERRAVPDPSDDTGARRPASMNPGYDREPRTALTALLDVDGIPLRVTSTHLSYLPWRALAQLRAVLPLAAGDGTASVLAGDVNLPVWPVRLALGRAWRHLGGTPTYPAWDPRLQVDQIAVAGAMDVREITVGPPGPSDHLPVVAEVALRR